MPRIRSFLVEPLRPDIGRRDPQETRRTFAFWTEWRWHLDELFVKINGGRHYWWRSVNLEGEVLRSFVMKARDRKAASKFLKKPMRQHGRREAIVTDLLRSPGVV